MKKVLLTTLLLLIVFPVYSRDFKQTEAIINSILNDKGGSANTKGRKQNSIVPENRKKINGTSQKEKTAQSDSPKKEEKQALSMTEPDEVIMKTGIQFYNSGLYKFSLKQFNELNSKYPQSKFKDTSKIYSGKIHLKLFQYNKAIKAFSSVPKDSGEYASSLYHLGEAHMIKGNLLTSIENYQKVSSQFPEHELADNALLRISRLYLKNRKGQQALQAAVSLIKYYKTRETIDDAYYMLGLIFMRDPVLKDIETARKVYKVFLSKAKMGENHFKRSPLRNRVRKDLAYIERNHYKLEQ